MSDWMFDDGSAVALLNQDYTPPLPPVWDEPEPQGAPSQDPLFGDKKPDRVGDVIIWGTQTSDTIFSGGNGGRERDTTFIEDGGDIEPILTDTPCADTREALEIQQDIKSKFHNRTEYVGITYTDPQGRVQHSPTFPGRAGSGSADLQPLFDWMTANGVGFDQVTSFTHNHDEATYGGDDTSRDVNRYPSSRDWQTARVFVERGANPSNFSLFLMDTRDVMREFDFSDMSLYEGMTTQEKLADENLPDDVTEDDLCG